MFAVATLLYDPKYLPGALVLGHTLRKITPPNIKLVVLIDKACFTAYQLGLLVKIWDDLIDTQITESCLHKKLKDDLKRPELAKTFTKIELWNLPYEKVLYLDADTLPLEGRSPVTNLLKLDFPRGKILAAPDSGFPDIFNSGVFALTPDKDDYANLSGIASSGGTHISFDGADQGLLNQYFNSNPDWVSRLLSSGSIDVSSMDTLGSGNWIRIPFLYNTTPNAQYEYYPASSHFGYPEAASAGTEGSRAPHYQGDETTTKVSVYENIALHHFSTDRAGAQVSVLHFIGASKPWNNESSPLFEKWWTQWYEFSGGRSLDSVMGYQKYPASVKRLELPSATYSSSQHKRMTTPAELCDPSNYQHLRSNIEVSASCWDATKESPPKDVTTSSLGINQKPLKNKWDETEQINEARQHGPNGSHTKQRILKSAGHPKPSENGFHEDQAAERVFDESSDYIPRHILMTGENDSRAHNEANPTYPRVEPVENLENLLAKTRIQDQGPNDVAREMSKNSVSGVPKIFPWEHRDMKPERVWE